jgi:trk system potassium uptake protein TrkH
MAFMLIFSINFNAYYLLFKGKIKDAFTAEIKTFLIIVIAAMAIIFLNLHFTQTDLYTFSAEEEVRHTAFYVASLISTTGFCTVDFNLWPTLSKSILFLLMFSGACAGSTAGGLKLSRVILLFKQVRSNLRHMLHPRSVESVRLEGKKVDNETLISVTSYFALYFLCFTVIFLIISIADPFNLETNITATAACFNNIGPGFSGVGPMSSYADYSVISKWTLSAGMLLGRLEILPLILLFAPGVWIRSNSKKELNQYEE